MKNTVVIPCVRLHPEARLPEQGSEFAVGYDLFLCSPERPIVIRPGETKRMPTGLAMAIPKNNWVRIEARSGLAVNNGITTLCGVIDPDYRGEIQVVLHNLGSVPVALCHGDKIAQMVIHARLKGVLYWQDSKDFSFEETKRGTDGFGSTG